MNRLRAFLKRRGKLLLISAVSLLVVVTLGGFFVVPPILKAVLTSQMKNTLHRDVTIREVLFNPFALSATVRGLAIKEVKGPETFVSFDELYLRLGASSPFRWAAVVREVRLTKPFIRIVRRADQSYNFTDLIPPAPAQPEPPKKEVRFSVNNIRIIDGGADFIDEPEQKTHTVRDFNLGIPFVSNISSYVQTFVRPALSVKINDTPYAVEGETKPFAESRETTLDIAFTDLNLPFYLAYVPSDLLTFTMPSGRLDAKLTVVFAQHQSGEQTLAVRGTTDIRQLAVADRQGKPVVTLPKLSFALTSVEPLVRKAHLSKITLESPEVAIRREKTGAINVLALVPQPAPAAQSAAPPPASAGPAFALDVDEIGITGAKVTFADLVPRTPFATTLSPIDVSVKQLSTRPNTQGTYSARVATEAKERIALDGQFSLTPLAIDGNVNVQAVVLKKYAPYYSDILLCDVEGGTIDVSSRYKYAEGDKEPEITASEAALSVSGLRLKRHDEAEEFLRVPTFAVKQTSVDVARRRIVVGDISTRKGVVSAKRLANGDVDLQKVVASAPETPAPPERGRGSASAAPKPWVVALKRLALDQYTAKVEDQTTSEPINLTIEDIAVKVDNLSTAEKQPPAKVSLALRVSQGTVSLTGTASVAPVAADLQVAVNAIDIRPFQPYVADKISVNITGGRVSTNGRVELSIKDPQGLQAKFTGETHVSQFAAIEKTTADELLKWDSLAFQELAVGYSPLSVRARKIALADFATHVIVQPNGQLNLQQAFQAGEPSKTAEDPQPSSTAPATATPSNDASASAPSSPRPDIQIDEVTVQGGHVRFEDRSLKPAYFADMTEIGGRVSGLSTGETTLADLELRGKMNNSAPLEITGKVNPLKQDLFADVRARFTGMDLSPTTPYSGKYVGYTIEKGKLSFDLNYHIDKRKLNSENKIFVDQFTFGDKVDSPTATSLPVKLAVALLKDRNGLIHLDIPVTGSLDDPQFSIWRIILQVIGNLITKAVASPFALLGAAFGGGEGMQYVEFDPGRATIPADGLKKIDTLATALSEKPALKLEIAGYVSPEADREGLKQYLLQRKVKAQKLNDLVKKGTAAVPVDDVVVEQDEYEKYLTLAYRAEPFPKPRNVIGLVKSLPVPEMEKLMLANIQAGPEELRLLAAQRANAVKDALLRSGKVEAERLFIVEPKSPTPEKKDNVKESRVEFKIA